VVYYDAFAPDKQPGVWSQEMFDKLFLSMSQGGVLTTYCAKGSVRRMMQQAGFTVERIPGASGKREMLRANVLENSDTDKEKKE
jgi:tRNA U34 5-methylaminomethyl-2-thiouridine-forming methyltransferase MnmC